MGAKQSKRSVDISGKEAEGAGEVAVAGAGGEGRVEQLADADALKPQLNGDAHIEPSHEQTEKEKQLDSGTPENEKDATTEKERKEQENEKQPAPVTNGESEQKGESNEETAPASEDNKKPKKEKVKKKWSLRSISFSRKEKPKQEKKLKEEEAKTNGESEKVPEEATEATPATIESKAEETKPETEIKEAKTPETPVTEPITNGSTTPSSPKVETPAIEETAAVRSEIDRTEPKIEEQPEQLPVNGPSLEEPKEEVPELTQSEESKTEPAAETTENVPAPEIPVKTEVCVKQMPLIEPTPPPLPANPPPSSVASFAATTMAPELTDASLANTTDTAISTLPAMSVTKTDKLDEVSAETQNTPISNHVVTTELPPPLRETIDEKPDILRDESVMDSKAVSEPPNAVQNKANPESVVEIHENIENDSEMKQNEIPNRIEIPLDADNDHVVTDLVNIQESPEPINNILETIDDLPPPPPPVDIEIVTQDVEEKMDVTVQDSSIVIETNESVINSNHILVDTAANGIDKERFNGDDNDNEIEHENLKNKTKDKLGNVETIECNGNIDEKSVKKENITLEASPHDASPESAKAMTPDDSTPPSLSEAIESIPPPSAANEEGAANEEAPESRALPPGELRRPGAGPAPRAAPAADTPQDPLPDKMTDLIAEVPAVPELKTEMLQETTSDVAVAN